MERLRIVDRVDPWFDDQETFDLASLGSGALGRIRRRGIDALFVAILDDAIQCYLSPVAAKRTEAEYWITSKSQRSAFSFCSVCEILGLDPDAVRSAVQALPRRTSQRGRAIPRSRPNVRS